MSFWNAIPIVSDVINGVLNVVDKSIEDKDKKNELKSELTKIFNHADLTEFTTVINNQAKIITAEAQGESSLQKNWRPILMLTIVAIVANNYIIFPYLSLFTNKAIMLELPDKLYNLMTIGVGGYITGRSCEKAISMWKDKK